MRKKANSDFTRAKARIALLALALSLPQAFPAHALTTSMHPPHPAANVPTATTPEQPIIVAPQPSSGNISLTGEELGPNIQGFFSSSASTLGGNLESLGRNLAALSQYNTPENQQVLDKLGSTYGNIPSLGTNFKSGVASIKIDVIGRNASTISEQLPKLMRDFSDAEVNLAKLAPPQEDIKAAQNASDPQKALEEMSTKISPAFQAAQLNLFKLLYTVVKTNNAICALNSNIESLRNTYGNLLAISSQPPSVIIQMHNLPQKLGALNGLAISQFGGLAQLGGSMESMVASLDSLQKGGGLKQLADEKAPTVDMLGQFGGGLEGFYSLVSEANADLEPTLGGSKTKPLFELPPDKLKELTEKASASVKNPEATSKAANPEPTPKVPAVSLTPPIPAKTATPDAKPK
jgi:hypothetical protein